MYWGVMKYKESILGVVIYMSSLEYVKESVCVDKALEIIVCVEKEKEIGVDLRR